MDAQLRSWNAAQPPRSGSQPYTAEWIENPAKPLWEVLNPKQRGGNRYSAYQTALERATADRNTRLATHARRAAPVTHDDLVAHLTFGTWVGLLPRRQLSGHLGPAGNVVLWNQALMRAFPNHQNPTVISYWLSGLRLVRNRVAHMESLLDVDAIRVNRTAIRLLRAVDSTLGDWLSGISRVGQVAGRRP